MNDWQKELLRANLTGKDIPESVPASGVMGYYIGKICGHVGHLVGKGLDAIPIINNIKAGFTVGYAESGIENPGEQLTEVVRGALKGAISDLANTLGKVEFDAPIQQVGT